MKLEKREITLNEKDSVTDMLYLEKNLLWAYEKGENHAERKEVKGLCQEKREEIQEEIALLEKEIQAICFAP